MTDEELPILLRKVTGIALELHSYLFEMIGVARAVWEFVPTDTGEMRSALNRLETQGARLGESLRVMADAVMDDEL